MFQRDRVFSNRNIGTGCVEWFYETREGTQGPFESERTARAALERHIEYSKLHNLDGGRKLGLSLPKTLELEALEQMLELEELEGLE